MWAPPESDPHLECTKKSLDALQPTEGVTDCCPLQYRGHKDKVCGNIDDRLAMVAIEIILIDAV